jgi:hypothetical protein
MHEVSQDLEHRKKRRNKEKNLERAIRTLGDKFFSPHVFI